MPNESKGERKGNLNLTDSMASIEIMMRRLLEDHDARAAERSRRLHVNQKRAIETAIAQHVQSLNAAIAQEKTACALAIANEHHQIQKFKIFGAAGNT